MFSVDACCGGFACSAAYTMTAAMPPCSNTDSTTAMPAPRSSAARWARTSPTRSCIALLRLRDHAELFDARAVHHVEHRDDFSVRHSLIRLEPRAAHATRAQHRSEGLLEIRRADGSAVDIHRARGVDRDLRGIVRRHLERLPLRLRQRDVESLLQ